MKAILILTTLGLSTSVFSSEVDSYHGRNDVLKDSTDQINQYANVLFDSVLDKTNKKGDGCDELALYKNLRKEFRNHLGANFNKYISYSPELDRVKIKTADSIYGDFNTRDSIVLGFYSHHIVDPIATALNIRGHFVGSDKFEHFAGTGFRYFKNYYLKKNSIESTLEIGQKDEFGLLGSYTTGVISYGDMTAEFNGMRFWNHVLAKNPDILDVNLGPYVKCENDRWLKVSEIDFGKYVDDAWDEGMNCSSFRTERMVNKVKESVRKLEEATGEKFSCPMVPERIEAARLKYGRFADMLISTAWKKGQKKK